MQFSVHDTNDGFVLQSLMQDALIAILHVELSLFSLFKQSTIQSSPALSVHLLSGQLQSTIHFMPALMSHSRISFDVHDTMHSL